MIKISLSILTVYLIYYAGNILYDLFLKKEKEVYKEETEEFSLSGISQQYEGSTQNVGIDDVENIKTPKSFGNRELISIINEESEERPDLLYLKEKYESEQDIEKPEKISKQDFTKAENQSEPEGFEPGGEAYPDKKNNISNEQELQKPDEMVDHNHTSSKHIENSRIIEWKKMLNLSETLVQLVSNNEGHKVYQSTM